MFALLKSLSQAIWEFAPSMPWQATTAFLGKRVTMPGLPKNPNYEGIKLNESNNIIGLF